MLGGEAAGADRAVFAVTGDDVMAVRIKFSPLKLDRHVLFDHEHRLAHRTQIVEISVIVGGLDAKIGKIARKYAQSKNFLFLGRQANYPIALEGALKLKEISYIPTEAYAAGEMKHGPIALLEEGSPVVVVATDSHVFAKLVSNIEEVRARGADVIAVASEGNEEIAGISSAVLPDFAA